MDPQTALADLQTPKELSILTLAEPFLITAQDDTATTNKRTSNASSTEGREGATPAILSADLTHYQELFSKLRFSYVEQVTKERFLRAITADQPEFVDGSENLELEEKLKGDKAALKERKEEVRELVKELEEQGRQLAARKSIISKKSVRMFTLTMQHRIRERPTPNNPTLLSTFLNRQPRIHHLTTPTIQSPKVRRSSSLNAAPTHSRPPQRTRRAAHGSRQTD